MDRLASRHRAAMDHQVLLARLLRKSDIGRRDSDAVQVQAAL